MSGKSDIPRVRVLPEDVANKIAAGEVVERPASVVKELVENALDARASRISVRVVAAGRRLIEVVDNGHGMTEQDALLAIERHATSKIRKADDIDNIITLGFRGEALASIAAVSHFELVTRRARDDGACRVHVDGGIMGEVTQVGAPVGTRISVNRLYFNTPVRAKFLKGITTELSHCIDVVQRLALSHPGVGFQFIHNEKMVLDIAEHTTLRERVALIWGLNYANSMVELKGEMAGLRLYGLVGTPALTRSTRSHQFFFMNRRPILNRGIQYGFQDGYQGLLTVGRHPVGVVCLETHPRFVDVNIHPAKREIRFRDERAARDAVRTIVRQCLEGIQKPATIVPGAHASASQAAPIPSESGEAVERTVYTEAPHVSAAAATVTSGAESHAANVQTTPVSGDVQTEFTIAARTQSVEPQAVYTPVDALGEAPMQLFDTYLLVPEDDRLLIIDQHALHERLSYDALRADLDDRDYASQQLAVPVVVDVPPAHAKLLEANVDLFKKLGMDIEPFGASTFQVTAICHMYRDSQIPDAIFAVLDQLAQGDLFDREDFMADLLRLALRACKSSVKAGDILSDAEKSELLAGFRRMRPPYTCPHGRPIITELTMTQMEKSFRRRQ